MRLGQDPRRGRAAHRRERTGVRRRQLARYKIPRYVMVVDEFPMTVTGKVRKVEMRERSVGLLALDEAAAIRHA